MLGGFFMRICYIKHAEKEDEYINYTSKIKFNFMKKIIIYFKKTFNIITVKPIGDGVIFYLPNKKNVIKLADKIGNKLQYYNINNSVIENNLNIDNFKNRLYEKNINILDGRWLFNYLLIDILEYITNLQKEKLENQEVSIAVNDLNEEAVNNIYEIASTIKRLNVITNNIEKLKNIESKLYKEKGIMITVSNNKRKSLAKAKIILNIDFPEEMLNKYIINKKAILINIEGKVKINNKTFNGVNINYYNIEINNNLMNKFIENDMIKSFDKNILYESMLYSKTKFQNIREKIKKDEIIIKELIGNNGIINEKEYMSSCNKFVI